MRLTKGQLKRIIREEHSKLRRRGLLREFGPPTADDLADFEYDQSGEAELNRGEIQSMVQKVKAELEKRQKINLRLIEFVMNDLMRRMSQGEDEYYYEDDGRTYYDVGRMLEQTDTPFTLREVDRCITSPIDRWCDDNGIRCSWNYSWT